MVKAYNIVKNERKRGMNILLIFFALPIATIIISIALQKILRCPPLVAAIIFSIFLVVTFIINSLTFLVATIAYTIISFITAVIVCIICRILKRNRRNRRECDSDFGNCFVCGCERNRSNCINDSNNLLTINSNCQDNRNGDLLTISSCDWNGTSNDLLTISGNNFNGNNNWNNNCGCNSNNGCGNNSNNSNGVTARINVIPTTNNNGRSGCSCGGCRR